MAEVFYPAILERGADGYGLFFPDLPGCVSAGETADEAARGGAEALALHLEGMIEDGEELPPVSALDELPSDPEVEEVARMLVGATLPSRAARINVTIDEGLLARIDRAAEESGLTRSGFLAQAARERLGAPQGDQRRRAGQRR
jgi:predicted RNase H-like HicB family nuclease